MEERFPAAQGNATGAEAHRLFLQPVHDGASVPWRPNTSQQRSPTHSTDVRAHAEQPRTAVLLLRPESKWRSPLLLNISFTAISHCSLRESPDFCLSKSKASSFHQHNILLATPVHSRYIIQTVHTGCIFLHYNIYTSKFLKFLNQLNQSNCIGSIAELYKLSRHIDFLSLMIQDQVDYIIRLNGKWL